MRAAFASGDSAEVIPEKPITPGQSLREGLRLDIDAELRLVGDVKKDLTAAAPGDDERKAMKELGLAR